MKRLQEIYIMEAAVHLDSFLVLHIKLLCTLHATLLISNYIFPEIFSDLHSFSLFSFRWLYYLHKEYEIKKDTAEAVSLSYLFLINVIVFYQLYCISYFKLIV